MLNDNLKNQFYLHFIVFIWGFTAILGALITVNALTLVWYRVLIASITLFLFFKFKKEPFKENYGDLFKFLIGGILIAIHWITFFHAIKISTISTTLVTMSSSAFFVVLLQPLFGIKKFTWYELLLAVFAVAGFVIIFNVEKVNTSGLFVALISAFLVAVFSIYNGNLIKKYKGSKIAFYELVFATLFITVILIIQGKFSKDFFSLLQSDIIYIAILAVICTAFSFVVATNLLRKMSPFTIVLTNNLEPVYGIILAVLIFGDKEKMSLQFYLGAVLILCSVLVNAFLKNNVNKLRFKKQK
jgi:drug/metabolite transporter (DMT)-like permease